MRTKVTVVLDPTFVVVPTHKAVRLAKKGWGKTASVRHSITSHFPVRLQFSKVEEPELVPVQVEALPE